MASNARRIRALDDDFHALQTVGGTWRVVENIDAIAKGWSASGKCELHGQQRYPGTSPCGGCAEKGGCQAVGRSKGGFGTKMHVLVDSLGRLLGLLFSPGQGSDHAYAPELAKRAIAVRSQAVMGDKGYDSNKLRDQMHDAGIEVLIPFRKCRKVCPEIDRERYKQRNIIERFIGKIKENRRVATRYDKKVAHFAGFVILAAVKSWLKNIC